MKKTLSFLLTLLLLLSAWIPSTGVFAETEGSDTEIAPLSDDVLTDTSDTVNFPQYPNEGAVRTDKRVINTGIYNDTGVAQIEISTAGIPTTEAADIVLIIDASGSMNKTTADGVNKFTAAKNAAKDFIATVTGNGSASNLNRVALVIFADAAEQVQGMTLINSASTLTAFKNKISGLSYFVGGGTNYDDPLKVAGDILESAKQQAGYENRKQVVVFMTDGAPGIYNRACPFYFHVYGNYGSSTAGNLRDKVSYLRNEVKLTVSEYFWQTAKVDSASSATDKTYSYDLYDYSYKGATAVYLPYVSGDSSGSSSYGTKFAKFINTYWYDYVSGNLNPDNWVVRQYGFNEVNSLTSGKKYIMTTKSGSTVYALSDEGSPGYITDSVPIPYAYFYKATVSNQKDGTKKIVPSGQTYPSSIKDYLITVGTASGNWTFRNDTNGYYLRFNTVTNRYPGWGIKSGTYEMYRWVYNTSTDKLYNRGEYDNNGTATYLRMRLDGTQYYLSSDTSANAAAFTFYEMATLDPVPKEYETYGNLKAFGGTGDNIFGARIKGTATQADLDKWGISGSPLNAELYTIGFALDADDGGSRIDACAGGGVISFTAAQARNVLSNMASDSSKAVDVNSESQLKEAYADVAKELIVASASNATLTDKLGAQYDLQLDNFVQTENGTQALGFDPTIEVGYYELASDGTRGAYTTMETLTYAANYNAATNAIEGKYVTYDLDTETFSMNFTLEKTCEYALRYWVHLEGSSEGTLSAGTYNTNEYAYLDYTNHLGNACRQTFPVPQLPWSDALTRYTYYLVNEEGQPINTDGEVVAFSERITIGDTHTINFLLNSTQTVNGNATVPECDPEIGHYELYNPSAHYAVYADSDGTGEVVIYDATQTTYVTAPNISNSNEPFTGLDPDAGGLAGYTATTFAFAVVLKEKPVIQLYSLGAQAHIIHQNKTMDSAGLYTDGIRFGYSVNYQSLQAVLNEGDYFQTGMLLMPMNRINSLTDYATADAATRSALNADFTNVKLASMNIASDGTYTTTNSYPVFAAALNEDGSYSAQALGADSSMVQWTAEMDAATSAEELKDLLRSAGVSVFGAYRDEIRIIAYMRFGGDATSSDRQAKADREIVSRGFFIALHDGTFTVYHTQQFANSATRIFNDYNMRYYNVSNVPGATANELLNGASRFAPTVQN